MRRLRSASVVVARADSVFIAVVPLSLLLEAVHVCTEREIMGIAAYNRGSRAISNQITQEQRPSIFRFMDDLTEYSARHNGSILFSPTVIRIAADGSFHLMNRKLRGWGEFGYRYNNIWEVARYWRLAFIEMGRDEHSLFYQVQPGRRA